MQTRFARDEVQSARLSLATPLQICEVPPARFVRELLLPGLSAVSLLDVSLQQNPARPSFPAIAKIASQHPGVQHQLQPAIKSAVPAQRRLAFAKLRP